jgi:hypothetical protein
MTDAPTASHEGLKARFLAANLQALGIKGRSKQAILEAPPKGRLVRLADGNPALEVDGRIIGAPADARSRATSLDDVEGTDGGVAVVFGVGAGHSVRELREHSSAKLVVFEPDPGVLRMVLESGPSDLGGIPIFCDANDLEGIWSDLARDQPAAALVRTPGYDAAYPEAVGALAETIRMLVADVSLFANTRAFRFRNWIEDVFANVDVLCETSPFLGLANRYASVPAFIIGAGPSLKKNVALLGEAARRGIVFAVDVSGKVLAKHGVEPQVLVCLEALNLSHHMSSLPFIDRVVRAFSLTASPASLSTGNGPLLPFFEILRAFSPVEQLLGVQPVSVGGSVSTVAFSLAEKLGCSPIVLVGQDLAYTDGRTHAEGTAFEASRTRVDRTTGTIEYDYCQEILDVRKGSALGPPQSREQLFEVPGWGGEEAVSSTSAFNGYRKWFEGTAEVMAAVRPGVRLVNATEGGSHIAGFEECTLEDVLKGMPEQSITSQSLASAAAAARPPLLPERVQTWAERQAELARAAGMAASRLTEAVEVAKAAITVGNPKKVTASFRELARLEDELRTACSEQPFLEGWAYAHFHDLMLTEGIGAPEGDTQAEATWGLDREARMAEVLAEAARELDVALSDISKRMSSRQTMARSSHIKTDT